MGDHEALLKALEDGANVETTDAKTMTSLHWAAKCGRHEDVLSLLEAGANVNAQTKAGVTPLTYAASEGWDDIVPVLLSHRADTAMRTAKGRTALEAATEKMQKVDAEEQARFAQVVELLSAAAPAAASPASGFGSILAPVAAPAAPAAPSGLASFTFAPVTSFDNSPGGTTVPSFTFTPIKSPAASHPAKGPSSTSIGGGGQESTFGAPPAAIFGATTPLAGPSKAGTTVLGAAALAAAPAVAASSPFAASSGMAFSTAPSALIGFAAVASSGGGFAGAAASGCGFGSATSGGASSFGSFATGQPISAKPPPKLGDGLFNSFGAAAGAFGVPAAPLTAGPAPCRALAATLGGMTALSAIPPRSMPKAPHAEDSEEEVDSEELNNSDALSTTPSEEEADAQGRARSRRVESLDLFGGNVPTVCSPEMRPPASLGPSFASLLRDGGVDSPLGGPAADPVRSPPTRMPGTPASAPSPDDALLEAATSGNLEALREALDAGASAGACDSDGNTALHLVSRDGRPDGILALLRAKALPDSANAQGVTPLMAAAQGAWHDCVQMLLNAGADADRKTLLGRGAADFARARRADAGEEERPRYDSTLQLLEAGVAPAACTGRSAAAAMAPSAGLVGGPPTAGSIPAVVQAFASTGAGAPAPALFSFAPKGTPFGWGSMAPSFGGAAGSACPPAVAASPPPSSFSFSHSAPGGFSFSHSAPGGFSGLTPARESFSFATTRGETTSSSSATPFCFSPMADAASACHVSQAPAAATSSPAKKKSATPDDDLINAAEMGDHEALLKALEDGANVETTDAKTMTSLHWAAKCGRHEDVLSLLEAGANVNAQTKAGVTPLTYAASEGWDDIVPVLLSHRADTAMRTAKGRTALQAATEKMNKVDAEERLRFAAVVDRLSYCVPPPSKSPKTGAIQSPKQAAAALAPSMAMGVDAMPEAGRRAPPFPFSPSLPALGAPSPLASAPAAGPPSTTLPASGTPDWLQAASSLSATPGSLGGPAAGAAGATPSSTLPSNWLPTGSLSPLPSGAPAPDAAAMESMIQRLLSTSLGAVTAKLSSIEQQAAATARESAAGDTSVSAQLGEVQRLVESHRLQAAQLDDKEKRVEAAERAAAVAAAAADERAKALAEQERALGERERAISAREVKLGEREKEQERQAALVWDREGALRRREMQMEGDEELMRAAARDAQARAAVLVDDARRHAARADAAEARNLELEVQAEELRQQSAESKAEVAWLQGASRRLSARLASAGVDAASAAGVAASPLPSGPRSGLRLAGGGALPPSSDQHVARAAAPSGRLGFGFGAPPPTDALEALGPAPSARVTPAGLFGVLRGGSLG